MISSFFFTNNTDAPHGDTLDRKNPLSTKSWSWVFNSFSSASAMLYGGIETGVELGNSSILNYNSLSGGKPEKSLGNTLVNSHTTGTLSKVTSEKDLSIIWANYASQPLCSNLLASNAEITDVGRIFLSPSNFSSGYPRFLNMVFLVKQSIET